MIILYSALQNQNQLKNSTLILDMLKLFANLHQCEKGKFFWGGGGRGAVLKFSP